MALPEAVAVVATELGCINEFRGESVIVLEFAAGLVGVAFGKHPRLPHVEYHPVGALPVVEASWH